MASGRASRREERLEPDELEGLEPEVGKELKAGARGRRGSLLE